MERLIQKVRECSVEDLNLMCSSIGNDELRVVCDEIKHITSLKKLWLCGNPISGVLRCNTSLEVLSLWGSRISDIAPLVEELKCNYSLKMLGLNNNQITDAIPLCEALKYNTSLEFLDLNGNRISDATPICEALKYNTSLVKLYLNDNPISDPNSLRVIEEMTNINRYNAQKRNKTLFEMMLDSDILE